MGALRTSFVSWIVLCAATLVLSAGPSFAQIDPGGGVGGGPLAGTLDVIVIDERTGAPVPGAFCQVGMDPGVPFSGNLDYTDGNGEVQFNEPALTGPQTVTVGKDGYTYFTIYDVDAAEMILPIREKGSEVETVVYEGDVNGVNVLSFDNKYDVALVLPALSIDDLTSLGDIASFAPTVIETFPLIGGVPLSGAIYMPYQIELLIPVERTPYAINLVDQSVQDIYAFYGRLPVTTLLDNLGSDELDFLSIVQDFDIREYGIVENISVDGPGTQDLDLTNEDDRDFQIHVDNTTPGTEVLVFAAADLDGLSGLGRILPCGFGGLEGGITDQVTLATIQEGGPFTGMDYIAGAIQTDTVEGLANSFVADRTGLPSTGTASATTFFSPPVPSAAGATFSWTTVVNAGISPAPDLHTAEISLVTTVPDTTPGAEPGDTLDIPQKLWEFVADGSALSFTIPRLGPNVLPGLVDPAATADQDRLDWTLLGVGLGLAVPFDYDQWDIIDRAKLGTHAAWNTEKFISFPDTLWTGLPMGDRERGLIAFARPNPFRREITLEMNLFSTNGPVRLEVYDVRGRLVRVLLDGSENRPGSAVSWNGTDRAGRKVAPGTYFFRLRAGDEGATKKVVLTR